jgi:hypothetical protein
VEWLAKAKAEAEPMSDYFDVFDDMEPEQPVMLEEDRVARPRRQGGSGWFFNLVSLLFMVASVGVIVVTVMLIQNPTAPFNPFPPPPPPPTPTLFLFEPVGDGTGEVPATDIPTPAPTGEPSSTPNLIVTDTPRPTVVATATGLTPLPGATNTVTVFPFTLQDEAVTYTQNPNEEGCAWLSIAGQVFDLNGDPLPGLPVQVTGEDFEQIEFTGTALQFGPSGYEVLVNTTPIEAEFVVRLLNTTGQQLSDPIVVRTLSSCERNVAVVNFVQNHEFAR